ncbi:MAG TPA: SURF1 family protein [Gemmatimonadaceae bacterium]|nr:SURF1 family protein [Gemmatimonadaceae bacterium]
MTRKLIAFVSLAGVLAALFIRLGFWQLARRAERRSANAEIASQLALPPRSFHEVRSAPEPVNRRVRVEGEPDFANEFVVTGRSRNGSPGVHILTPVRVPGQDSAVLVNRGWVYSADAASVDLSRWREGGSVFTGFTQEIPEGVAPAIRGRGLRPLTRAGVQRLVTYPVSSLYLVVQDSAPSPGPARLSIPMLDDGPHLSYAVQWFAFAAIALGGTFAVLRRSRRGATAAMDVQERDNRE